jgi:Ni/Fe-hydrogenase 1 B-type cytochrome subunit
MQGDKIRVYAWEVPVRLTHWVNVVSILVLSITGYYIGDPFIHASSGKQYIMGWMRFIHFVAAYTFLMSLIIRFYWSFMGNKYSRLKEWFPFSAQDWKYAFEELKFYLNIGRKEPHVIGHTALFGLAGLVVITISLFMVFSGFALYSVTHSGVLWTAMGGWLLGIMNIQTIRLFHHLLMYVILSFAIMHVYISWYSDVRKGNGMIGSIFNGYKFIPKDRD